MNLRNKKTGETGYYLHTHRDHNTGTLKVAVLKDGVPFSEFKPHEPIYDYDSLSELNADWEDYEPKEPLIKDAGARDVMRMWAKVNRIPTNSTTIEYHFVESLCGTESEFWDNNLRIMFYGKIAPNAVQGKIYTIDELCGDS